MIHPEAPCIHYKEVPCYAQDKYRCNEKCPKKLPCGHQVCEHLLMNNCLIIIMSKCVCSFSVKKFALRPTVQHCVVL